MSYIRPSELVNPQLTNVDIYGKMLVANDYFVISIIDRTSPIFGIYRPNSSNDFCELNMGFLYWSGTYVMVMAIPRDGYAAPNKFFFQGASISGNSVSGAIWGEVGFSMSPCGPLYYNLINSGSPSDYPLLAVGTSANIYLYTDNDFTYVRNVSSGISNLQPGTPWPDGTNFFPYTIDVAYGSWGVIAGAVRTSTIYVPTLYLITFPSSVVAGSYNYAVIAQWKAPFDYSWQSIKADPASGPTNFNIIYELSLSINDQGDILFGVQSMNTVFHLYVDPANPTSFIFKGSRIYSVTKPSFGFGKSVSWLDNTTAVILANIFSLDYTEWYSSSIEIYDLSNGKQLNDTQPPYSSFPSALQLMYSGLSKQILLMVASYAGSVIFMDLNGQVYIILPSPLGFYTITNVGNYLGAGVYFSSSALCPEGTSTVGYTGGKYLFDTCTVCPEGTFRPSSINTTMGCVPCDATQYFCPIAAVAEVPLSYTDTISQAVAFPRSPDITEFEDILLLNMFNTKFEANCLTTTPFFWTLIMLGITFIILVTMGILQLSGKCENLRTKVQSIFVHFDIINEGERWISGALSLSLFVIIIFAALFTNSFLKQYPSETSQPPAFTCDETLRNSQYSSQMQALGAAVPDDAKNIFSLLASQQMTLIVTLLNTIVEKNIIVTQTVGTITTTIQTELSVPTDGCVVIYCNLTANIATVNINISGSQAIGGVRIGLSAPSIVDQDNEAKEVNFINSFIILNQTMSQEPYFSMELIQVINETKPLSITGISQYSGLWIPTFSQDEDQNFYTLTNYEQYHTELYTILTIDISQAAYYIYNVEKPIIKTTEVTFQNILFASMCMEIFGFVILIFKLAIAPLLRLIVRLVWSKEEESKENNDDDESEKEEEEEHESDDDDDEGQQNIKLEPGKNEWYLPDVEI